MNRLSLVVITIAVSLSSIQTGCNKSEAADKEAQKPVKRPPRNPSKPKPGAGKSTRQPGPRGSVVPDTTSVNVTPSASMMDGTYAITECQQLEKRVQGDRLFIRDYKASKTGSCPIDPPNIAVSGLSPPQSRLVTVYFVRHGESTWNEYTKTDFTEQFAKLTPRLTDAHLSRAGIESVTQLSEKLFHADCSFDENEDFCFLAGNPESGNDRRVIYATSNLRRAVLTTLILFKDRLKGTKGAQDTGRRLINDIHILSSLQEFATNIDSEPVTPLGEIPYLTYALNGDNICPFEVDAMKALFSVQCNKENVNVRDEPAVPILSEFCRWVHYMSENGVPGEENGLASAIYKGATDIVIVGHSIWFRKFYNLFTDKIQTDPIAQRITSSILKISNQAIVKFRLNLEHTHDGEMSCRVEPRTTKMVNGKLQNRYGLIR